MSKKIVAHARPADSFWERNRKSGGYLLRKTAGDKAYRFVRFLLLFGLCFMIVQPLLSKISVSFMIEEDLYDSTIITSPRHLTLDKYQTASLPQLLDYSKAFKNTFQSPGIKFRIRDLDDDPASKIQREFISRVVEPEVLNWHLVKPVG